MSKTDQLDVFRPRSGRIRKRPGIMDDFDLAQGSGAPEAVTAPIDIVTPSSTRKQSAGDRDAESERLVPISEPQMLVHSSNISPFEHAISFN